MKLNSLNASFLVSILLATSMLANPVLAAKKAEKHAKADRVCHKPRRVAVCAERCALRHKTGVYKARRYRRKAPCGRRGQDAASEDARAEIYNTYQGGE